MKSIFLAMFLLPLTLSAQTNMKDKLYQKHIYHSPDGDSIPYRILFPENYSHEKSYPLILFLHGAGERGDDNEKQLTHGADFFLDSLNRKNYPAIVVFPQCAEDKYWVDISIRGPLHKREEIDFKEVYNPPAREQELAMELLKSIIKNESVDKSRLYIMGLSMGGFGTFEILARHPNLFAAAIPICGGGNIEVVDRYAQNTSLWITHGTLDEVVPVKYSREVYKALKDLGADVKYTEFADANHNAWDPTLQLPNLLEWLFSKSKR